MPLVRCEPVCLQLTRLESNTAPEDMRLKTIEQPSKRQANLVMEGQKIVKVPHRHWRNSETAKHNEEDTRAFQLSFDEDQF